MSDKIKNRHDFLKEMTVFGGSASMLSMVSWMKAFAQENGKNVAA